MADSNDMGNVPPKQPINGASTVNISSAAGLPHYQDPNEQSYFGSGTIPGSFSSAPNPGMGYVAVRSQAAQNDAAAIMKVFQDYMEAERQRSAKRIIWIAAVLSGVFLVVMLGFFVMWFSTIKSMQGTQNALITATLANNTALPAPQITGTPASAKQQNFIAEASSASEEKLTAMVKEAEEKAAAQAKANEETMKAVIAKMNETLDEVKKDNEQLRESVRKAAAEKLTVKPAVTKPAVPSKPKVKTQTPASASAAKPETSKVKSQAPSAAADSAKPLTESAQSESDRNPTIPDGMQRIEIRTIIPEVKVKRVDPPKGFKESSLELPAGKKGSEKPNWQIYIPASAAEGSL